MSRPRSRRALLASVATTAAATTGGFEYPAGGTSRSSLRFEIVPADRYECDAVDRPEPEPTADDDALDPRAYPAPPSATGTDENRTPSAWSSSAPSPSPGASSSSPTTVSQYVVDFERAYRQNAFLVRFGSMAGTVDLRLTDRRLSTVTTGDERTAVLVALCYDLTTGTRQSAPTTEWDIRVTYYVDERIVLRAQYDGLAQEPAFDPDPRTQGELVACFE